MHEYFPIFQSIIGGLIALLGVLIAQLVFLRNAKSERTHRETMARAQEKSVLDSKRTILINAISGELRGLKINLERIIDNYDFNLIHREQGMSITGKIKGIDTQVYRHFIGDLGLLKPEQIEDITLIYNSLEAVKNEEYPEFSNGNLYGVILHSQKRLFEELRDRILKALSNLD